jgi:hypothetical protein
LPIVAEIPRPMAAALRANSERCLRLGDRFCVGARESFGLARGWSGIRECGLGLRRPWLGAWARGSAWVELEVVCGGQDRDGVVTIFAGVVLRPGVLLK